MGYKTTKVGEIHKVEKTGGCMAVIGWIVVIFIVLAIIGSCTNAG